METESCKIAPEQLQKLEIERNTILSPICGKCRKGKSIFVFRAICTCWNCFEHLFEKKFKLNLKSARNGESEHVLLAFSGGPSSRALLHCLSSLIEKRGTKGRFFDVSVIHIDESIVLNLTESQKIENHKKIEEIVRLYSWPLIIIPLENIFSGDSLTGIDTNKNTSNFFKMFASITTNTSKEDFLNHLKFSLLSSVAQQNHVEKVLLGSSATRLAITLIASTCKGKGFSIPEELSISRNFDDSVAFVSPMLDFLSKEIAIYNRFNKLETCIIPTLGTIAPAKFSINHLSEGFIEGLQSEFFHTVHTLLRSGGKLSSSESSDFDEVHRCPICSCTLSPTDIIESKKVETNITSNSSCVTCGINKHSSCNLSSAKTCSENVHINNLVCYGCAKLLEECEPNLLPDCIHYRAGKLDSSVKLRDKIKDFLLVDN